MNRIKRNTFLTVPVLLLLGGCASIATDEAAKIYQEQGTIALYRHEAARLLNVSETKIDIREPFQSTPNNRQYLAIVNGKPYHCSLGIFNSIATTSIINSRCAAAR